MDILKKSDLRAEHPSTTCSCTKCESMFCFAKRHNSSNICSCENCTAKSCMLGKVKCDGSARNMGVSLNATKTKPVPRKSEAVTERAIKNESDRNKIVANQPPPKSLDCCRDQHSSRTPSERTGIKPESPSGYVYTVSGKNMQALESYIDKLKENSSQEPLRNCIWMDAPCKEGCKAKCAETSQITCKRHAKFEPKISDRKEFETEVRSVMLSSPNTDFKPTSNKLNAQDDIGNKNSSETFFTPTNSIFNYDILKKIKDAYNACSCVVCECIPNVITQNEICSCKPCECSDCKGYMLTNTTRIIQRQGMKYTPSQYIKQSLKQTQKRRTDCSCKPCECALCQKDNIAKACDCDLCQCNECKPKVTEARTPSGDIQNIPCKCTPCDCIDCARLYKSISKKSLLKVSENKTIRTACRCEFCPNDICANGDEACNCEKRNSQAKPMNEEKDPGMQTAYILNDIYHHNDSAKKSPDMIAMYSALPRIRNYVPNNTHAIACTCNDCECLTCVCKENTINAIKSSQLFSCDKRYTFNQNITSLPSHSNTKVCNCTPCECQVCTNRKREKRSYHQAPIEAFKKTDTVICSCKCDACLCSDTVPNLDKQRESNCKCSICKCESCVDNRRTTGGPTLNRLPIAKGEVLTPSAHQNKVQKLKLTKGMALIPNLGEKSGLSYKHVNSRTLSRQEVILNNKKYNPTRPVDVPLEPSLIFRNINNANRNTAENRTGFLKSLNNCDMFKYDACVQCKEWPKRCLLDKNNCTDIIPGSCISVYSSIETVSKSSLCKEPKRDASILDKRNKSSESSYNSSGHDQSRYLTRLPKSAAEICLEDFIKCNLGKEISLTTFDTSRKYHKELIADNKSIDSFMYNVMKPDTSFSTTIENKESQHSINLKNRNIDCKGNKHYCEPMNTDISKNIKNIKYEAKTTNSNSCEISINARGPTQFEERGIKSTPQVTTQQHDLNQFHTAGRACKCYNLSNGILSDYVWNDDSSLKSKESSYTFCSSHIDHLSINLDEDYKRVKRTLKDADKFSKKLLRLLASYEKANREFQKISDKLKASQVSIIKNEELNKAQELSNDETDNIIEHTSKTTRFEGTASPWSIVTDETQILPNKYIIPRVEDGAISQNYRLSDKNNVISNPQLSMNGTNNKLDSKKMGLNYEKSCRYNVKTRQYNKKPQTSVAKCGDNSCVIVTPNEDVTKMEERTRRRHGKICYSPPRCTYKIAKRGCLKKPDPTYDLMYRKAEVTKDIHKCYITEDRPCKDNEDIMQAVQTNKKHDLNLIMSILDPIIGNTEKTSEPVYLPECPSVNEIQSQTDELLATDISPTHDNVVDEYEYRKDPQFVHKNTMKQQQLPGPMKIDKLIGEPISYHDKGVSCGDMETINDLEDNVKELMNEFILQPLMKGKIFTEDIKDQNSYLSFESSSNLKVNFLLVKKVSDHTALVKWSRPRDLTDVQGYELLVDGRAVQKIFNPSKCIAVVTCLPHTEKILLTIRTVTSFVPETGHYPATTIIYRPRVRKQ